MQNIIGIQQAILDSLRRLSEQQQRSVLNFAEFLSVRLMPTRRPLKSLRGLWSNLSVDLEVSDFSEVRQEMWGEFGEDIEL